MPSFPGWKRPPSANASTTPCRFSSPRNTPAPSCPGKPRRSIRSWRPIRRALKYIRSEEAAQRERFNDALQILLAKEYASAKLPRKAEAIYQKLAADSPSAEVYPIGRGRPARTLQRRLADSPRQGIRQRQAAPESRGDLSEAGGRFAER